MKKKSKTKFNEITFGDFLIKEAEQKDVKDFRELYLKAIKEEPTLFADQYSERKAESDSYWKELIHNSLEDSRSIIALIYHKPSSQLVGLMMVTGNAETRFSHIAELHPIYILQSYLGPDLRTKVVNSVFMHLKQFSDVKRLQTFITTSQLDYLAFYNYLGFIRYGYDQEHFKVGKKYYDSVLLTKSL